MSPKNAYLLMTASVMHPLFWSARTGFEATSILALFSLLPILAFCGRCRLFGGSIGDAKTLFVVILAAEIDAGFALLIATGTLSPVTILTIRFVFMLIQMSAIGNIKKDTENETP